MDKYFGVSWLILIFAIFLTELSYSIRKAEACLICTAAAVSFTLSLCDFRIYIQVLTFFTLSVISTAAYKLLSSYLRRHVKIFGSKSLSGKRGILLTVPSEDKAGIIKIKNLFFDVLSDHPYSLRKGEVVKVTSVKGTTLYVSKS